MNNIWIATDWHLWNTEYDDGRHKFKSITRLGQLADEYTSVIGTNDLFIHLGDLCDPSNTKPEKLKAIIQSIPGTKILCRGNHDTEPDEYYLSAGFDHVCEILKIHDLVFSHKPVNVGVDQINIHGHLHTRKLSTLDGRYLNAYDVNYSDKPILLEDLLQHAVQQTKADYAGTEVKQDKINKMFDSIENDHYENILDLSEEFSLDEQFIQESTQMKSNIDKDFKSKGTKSLSDFKQVKLTEALRKKYSSTYKMLRHEYADGEKAKGGIITSIAWLDDDNLVAYTSVLKRDDGIYIESLEVTNDYKGYGLGTQLLNYVVDTLHGTILGVAYDNEIAIRMYENKGFKIDPESKEKVESGKSNNYLMIKETSIAPMLHSLSATEIEKDEDPLDEVIFEDPEDTIYWEQDDTDPKLYKEKEPMAEAVGAAIMTGMTIASGAKNVNSYFNNWYKQNEITDYVIFGTSEQKMYKCIDKTFKFKNTAERAADQVDRTFIYLRTSNNLNKKQKERYDIAKKYWSKVKKEYKAANESVENINEAVFNDEPDIYYNKDKFDANKTNKMLIVGFSGSGKSTMSYEYENDRNTEIIHLDEVYQRYDYYNEYNLKEISSLIYTFFIKDVGRRYWRSEWGSGAELIYDFMIFADKYADKNKGRRFIIEGVWPLYDFEPDFFDNWAVMIKGTARLKSIYRAAKRQYQYGRDLPEKINMGNRQLWSSVHINKDLEHIIDKWREYFSNKMVNINESNIKEVTLTAEHLAKLHKAHPELSTIIPDDGKDIHDPTKYYCSKAWIQDENIVATASIRYPQANSEGCYSKLEHFYVNENYCTEDLAYNLYEHVMVDLGDNRLNESPTIWTNDPVDIYDRKYEVLEEATKGTGELYPVYVFIVNSGSTISRAVEWYTGDKFTHAAISFEPSLNTMYSFGIKQENGKGAGFSVESINNKWYKGTDKQYAIYCVFVTKSQLKKMKDRVNYFIKHGTYFMFNLPGLVLNAFNISFNPKHAWFCSQFVADIINAGNTKNNTYIKDNSYMRPNDFTQTNFAHYICGGIIKNFRVSVVKAQTLKAMEQEKNARMLRGRKPMHYTVQRFQENAAELSPATREDMNKLNAKWDLRPIGYGDRDKYIAEEEEKLNKMREHNKKLKEIKDKNKQKLKAAKKEKQIRKLKIKNEEVYDPFNALDQDRFFDWNDYHNTVLGENSFKLELADKNFQFLNGIMESATGNDKLVPVFVILTHSYSAVSRMVRAATGDEYTHASISFDTSLTNMYTFGRTADRSVFEGSFKIEDVRSDYYQKHNPPIPYGLFCVPVTEAEKNKMLKKINYFAKNKDKFSFDFFGLFINAMGIPNNPKNRYFCSRFVSEILNAGDPKHPLIDEPSLQHPQSFVDEDFVRFVCSGDNIAVYDQSVADRVVKDIMRTEKLVRAKKNRVKNENFLGINPYNPFASDVLHYKFAMLDENEMDDFMKYLESFKIQYDKNDNIIISRKEYNQLEHYINTSIKLCSEYNETGNIDGIKEEMAKTHYMIQLINNYYLSPSTIKNPRINSDLKKEFIELRSVMLSHFNIYIKWIKIREPNFNFQSYYDTSKYSNTNMTPTKVLTAVDKVLVTAL